MRRFDDIAQKYITHTCSHSATEPTGENERAPAEGGGQLAASAPSHKLAGLPERSRRSGGRTASTERRRRRQRDRPCEEAAAEEVEGSGARARSGCAATPGRRRRRRRGVRVEADDDGGARAERLAWKTAHEGVGARSRGIRGQRHGSPAQMVLEHRGTAAGSPESDSHVTMSASAVELVAEQHGAQHDPACERERPRVERDPAANQLADKAAGQRQPRRRRGERTANFAAARRARVLASRLRRERGGERARLRLAPGQGGRPTSAIDGGSKRRSRPASARLSARARRCGDFREHQLCAGRAA